MAKLFSSKVAFEFAWSGDQHQVPVCEHAAPEEVFVGRADAADLCVQAVTAARKGGIVAGAVTFAEKGHEAPLPAPQRTGAAPPSKRFSSKFGLRFDWDGQAREIAPCENVTPAEAWPGVSPKLAHDLCVQAVAYARTMKGVEPGDVTFADHDAATSTRKPPSAPAVVPEKDVAETKAKTAAADKAKAKVEANKKKSAKKPAAKKKTTKKKTTKKKARRR